LPSGSIRISTFTVGCPTFLEQFKVKSAGKFIAVDCNNIGVVAGTAGVEGHGTVRALDEGILADM
jgi:hypothetical protein